MIFYITGSTYFQVIKTTVENNGELSMQAEVSDEVDFYKYVKNNITKLDGVEKLIVDFSVCQNTNEEIVKALEMLRSLYDNLRIIVFAPYLETGSELLMQCFNMGILNIINTDDFNEIRKELEECIENGKKFKDALKYKELKAEKLELKHEIKRTVNNHLIGVTGSEHRIGTTHTSFLLANFFRKKGFMVALMEMNLSCAFECIQDGFEEKEFEGGYFTLNGIDLYKRADVHKLGEVMEKSYNFIILDFGEYEKCDLVTFHKCSEKIIVAGAKPWEIASVNKIFEMEEQEIIKNYIFYFNYSLEREQEDIKKGMSVIKNVHFLTIENDLFSIDSVLPDAENVFAEYLPEKIEEEKKSMFARFGKKPKKSKVKSEKTQT